MATNKSAKQSPFGLLDDDFLEFSAQKPKVLLMFQKRIKY
jgi:hypothetical protein